MDAKHIARVYRPGGEGEAPAQFPDTQVLRDLKKPHD
jgi:hypothetical protein